MKRCRAWPATAFASLFAIPVAGQATAERMEEERLSQGPSQIDVGGASGAYALWLASLDFLATLPDGIDFVLVDYRVREFATAFEGLRDRMAVGCLLFVDGGPAGYWERDVVRDFKAPLEDDPCFVVTVLPMHKDQLIAVRVAA
ncbi:MAG: hypothetical protein VX815_16640 [Gemmatimonadota bacterium]|nr:hypothetical protein [Gemmatimonadota bacterium]